MPTFFIPKPSHQTKECEPFGTPPNRNNKTRVEYNHAPETSRVKNRCINGTGSVVSDSLWNCVDVMRLFPSDIQFHIFERVYRTHSADVARSCNLVMMREQGNTFIDPATRFLPINTLERVVPIVLTPADVAMNRTSYVWLFSLCCYNKIPVIFEFIGSTGIEESGYFKKFLELFYPIGWWKSTFFLLGTFLPNWMVEVHVGKNL
ncbi:uncharacterized protein LOC113317483 [Papaver somniferum]|uniref:uncharacterized protein LOC113317483 n=1 Tax=Papaver somniferum TaxID=3469 RepID=UPI000E6FF367|nr:uncharacterized protein LOC113317483 [Papaver somniferum]